MTKHKYPLARLKDSKNASFFPHHNPLSTWEYNNFHGYNTPIPTDLLHNFKNDWNRDDTIEVICYGI